MLAWLPVLVPASVIFGFEQSVQDPRLREMAARMIVEFSIGSADLPEKIMSDPSSCRNEAWSSIIFMFFRWPQAMSMVVLVGVIAPLLVTYDLRSKAYLMYFSRPLRPRDYILGKSVVIWFYISLISALPALLVFLAATMLSPDLSVLRETWDIPLKILLGAIVLVVPATSLALCYAAHTNESRYAIFLWFATWAIGFVSYWMLTGATAARNAQQADYPRDRSQAFGGLVDLDTWSLVSLHEILGNVHAWIFGVDDGSSWAFIPSVLVLVFVSVGGWWLIRKRIVARLSI